MEDSANRLSFIRILVFGVLLANALWEDLPSLAYLPTDYRQPQGIMGLVNAIFPYQILLESSFALAIFQALTILMAAMATIGFRTRATVPAATALLLFFGGLLREYTHFFHTMTAPLQIAMGLCFFDCGARYSLDRILSSSNDQKPDSHYLRGVFLCWSLISLSYFCAGLSKIGNSGLLWWQGANLKTYVATNSFSDMHFDFGLTEFFSSLPTPLFSILGLITLLIELIFPLVLFSRRARFWLPIGAVSMHLGILLTQGILFLGLIVLQASFYRFGRFSISTASWLPPQRPKLVPAITVIFILGWSFRLEFYPFTSWQMYSHDSRPSRVVVWKMELERADGTKSNFRPDHYIGALSDCRYRDYFLKGSAATRALLTAVINQANQQRQPQEPFIVRASVESWLKSVYPPGEETLTGKVSAYQQPPDLQ